MVTVGMRFLKTIGGAGVADCERGKMGGYKQAYIKQEIRSETHYACFAPVHYRIVPLKVLPPSDPVTS